MSDRSGFDWAGLMQLGIGRLGLRPSEFWALTPAEFLLMLGPPPAGGALDASGLKALVARYPDLEKEESHGRHGHTGERA